MRKLCRLAAVHKAAALSACFIAVVLAAALAPCISPYDPNVQDLGAARRPPSRQHVLGTDFQGCDILSKVIYGARPTIVIALGVGLSTVLAGLVVGLVAGYTRGLTDVVFMRIVDIMLAFPALLLNIILVALLGAGFRSLLLALTLTGWAPVARIVRSLTISLSNSQYCLAAEALGARGSRIVVRHILPNCLSTVIVVFAMRAGSTVLAAAGLNYLGLGAPSDANSWGTMVNLGQYDIVTAWWWPLAPASAIALTVLSMNLVADAASDYLDPRMARQLGQDAGGRRHFSF